MNAPASITPTTYASSPLRVGARSIDPRAYAPRHPGGAGFIHGFAGRDASDVYLAYHGGKAPFVIDTPYARLLRRVEEAGLMRADRRRTVAFAADLALFAASAALTQVHPLFAAPLAVAVLRMQYTQHDIFHNQWLTDTKRSVRLGNALGVLGGPTASWWKNTDHNPHHIHTGDFSKDPNEFLAVPPRLAILLPFIHLYLLWCSLRDGTTTERLISIAHIGLLAALLGPASFGVFLLGYALSWVPFQLLHHPTVPRPHDDWVSGQVTNTQHAGAAPWLTYIMGGHNFQIEHHLFPRVPRHRLPEVARLVEAWCAEQGLPYQRVKPARAWADFGRAWLGRHFPPAPANGGAGNQTMVGASPADGISS